jgi:hypothetical protein
MTQCVSSNGPMGLIYTTAENVQIFVEPGKKSTYDFIVRFRQPGGRLRTPRHVHLIVEMYVKQAHDAVLTMRLRDHLLGLFDQIASVTVFPPTLQLHQSDDVRPFQGLNAVGEFSVEFLLVVSELIFIQEKTNYPSGSLTQGLYRAFGVKDRFSVIGMATNTRYGGG